MTAAEERDRAYALGLESVLLQRKAFAISGEWRALGYKTFAEWSDKHTSDIGIRLEIEARREQVKELTEAGVPVADQAAILDVSHDTVKRDRKANAPSAQPEPQVSDPDTVQMHPDDWPADDLDAAPPDPAVGAAARAVVEAEMAALAERKRLEVLSNKWIKVSNTLDATAKAIATALKDDPHGEAMRAGQQSTDVAAATVDHITAQIDRLATLIDTTRADVLSNTKLRRIK